MSKVFIIAEAGVNHNGSLEAAKKLIEVAAEAGADAIKFQTFKADTLVTRGADKASYQKNNTPGQETQHGMIKRLEIDFESHVVLMRHAIENNIMFLSSPFDIASIHLLSKLGLNIFKIPSGEITNLPYLEEIGRLNKDVIMSTGMANLEEIKDALGILVQNGTPKEKITVLHCNTEYPTPYEDVNLRAMLTIKDALNINVGYSDHTLGIEVPIAAVAMGATVIEKHFTLDKNMEGPDHKASLDPDELRVLVAGIRSIENAMGNGVKTPSSSEIKNIVVVRKSIIALREIKKGEIFDVDNLGVKRPGTGISPMNWYEVLGEKASRNFQADELIEL